MKRHVLITGGTKGIGLEMAKLCIMNGSNVTILARNLELIEKICLQLKSMKNNEQTIKGYSIDLSKRENFNQLQQIVSMAEKHSGKIDLLICCAGMAIARTFMDCNIDDFYQMMDINYFTVINTIKSCLPSLKNNENEKHIVIFSSLAGLSGIYGYSAYSSSKFALIGLAETLHQELRPFNINITVSLPPDTQTPGYEQEQIDKPLITKLISNNGGLFAAQDVAEKTLLDCCNKKFLSTIGLDGFMLKTLCSGMIPCHHWSDIILQILLMSPLRIVGLYYLQLFEKIVQKNYLNEKKSL